MPKVKRPKPVVGQTVYVTVSGWLSGSEHIHEFIVTKVNTVSFYACLKTNNIERRFSLKTFAANNSIGDTFYAYLSEETPKRLIALRKEKQELKEYASKNIHKLKIDQLRTLKEMIDSK